MSDKPSFQARDHGNGILEIIGGSPIINSEHPAVSALLALSRKFAHLVLTLEIDSSVDPTALPKLLEVASSTNLSVVAQDPTAFPFSHAKVQTYSTIGEAITEIKGDIFAKQIMKKIEGISEQNSQASNHLKKLNLVGADFFSLGNAIADDPALADVLQKTAGSTFFMRRNNAETLSGLLSFLGIDGVKQILVFNVFKGLAEHFGVQRATLEHGRAVAYMATYLAEMTKTARLTISRIRLAGLIHDIGSMALAFYHPQEFLVTRRIMQDRNISSTEAETLVFGIEHQRLGHLIATTWGFPDYLVSVISNHHSLRDTDFEQLTIPVFCANGFMNHVIEGISHTPYFSKLRLYFKKLPTDEDFKADTETGNDAKSEQIRKAVLAEKNMRVKLVLDSLKNDWRQFKTKDVPLW
ncbi:MAG: HDOD domain-containing protein [Candidatus Ozemobacteraceae bacterium]